MSVDKVEEYALTGVRDLFGSETVLRNSEHAIKWLEAHVLSLLNNDFNALVNLLYRIDVYESKAKECFGRPNNEIAACLAALIWNRQMEKAKRKLDQKL